MKDNGGPAFPESYSGDMAPHEGIGGGMSLRDWFAGMALQGLLAHVIGVQNANGSTIKYAERCYEYADAMLAARKENQ